MVSLYCLILIVILAGFLIAQEKTTSHRNYEGFISVIVPFRDEALNLPRIIDCLKRQDGERFEVILVDDSSTDQSVAVARAAIGDDTRFTVISSSGKGKKAALTVGVSASKGEVIVTTDADCSMESGWLRSITTPLNDPEVHFSFGNVVIENARGLFAHLQQMEFLSVTGFGIGAFGLRRPVYCNGANLCFRKQVFESVYGYSGNEHLASGDDEFLMKKIHASYPDAIAFVADRGALVTTRPASTVREFIAQRIRWASKWRVSPGWTNTFAALLILLVQVSVLTNIYLLSKGILPSARYGLGGKVLLEFVFLFVVSQQANVRLRLFDFIILQVVYPFYVLYVGIAANISNVTWKGRAIR